MSIKVPSFQLYFDERFIAEIPVDRTPFFLGRKAGSHLRLIDNSVSRDHAKVTVSETGEIAVEDLASTNGTHVNGKRSVRSGLHPGDRVSLGRFTLVFHELSPDLLPHQGRTLFRRWWSGRDRSRFSKPRGRYILPHEDFVTEFDAVSYAMIQDQARTDGVKRASTEYLKKLPRLQVVAQAKPAGREEVTRFSVSKQVFEGTEGETLKIHSEVLPIFAQPEVRGTFLRIPWKLVERVIAPVILGALLIAVGKFVISFHLREEFKIAERHWNERLDRIAKKYRFASDEAFDPGQNVALTSTARTRPLTDEEVWKRIDSRSALRNFLLFEILDEILMTQDMKWSLDEALKNLSRLDSVTRRMPSVKKFEVVYQAEQVPFDLAGIGQGRVIVLAESGSSKTVTVRYNEYTSAMKPRLLAVNECAAARKTFTPGRVLVAFTVRKSGRASGIFINQAHSSKEGDLWDCVRQKLAQIEFPPPPADEISLVYTFNFAGPAKVEF